jgi:hypothetical protein
MKNYALYGVVSLGTTNFIPRPYINNYPGFEAAA